MSEIRRLLDANRDYVDDHLGIADAEPRRHLAIVTCMDARIDVFAALGLDLGDAHVIRNAGGRVTEDVLRSLALSSHTMGVTSVVVVQHTRCGLAGDVVEMRGLTPDDRPEAHHGVVPPRLSHSPSG